MEVKVCNRCRRFFEKDFLYCPYCGEKLHNRILLENDSANHSGSFGKENKSKEELDHNTIDETKQIDDSTPFVSKNFYDSLFQREKDFVNNFYCLVNKDFPLIKMQHDKTSTYFFREIDELILKNYAH